MKRELLPEGRSHAQVDQGLSPKQIDEIEQIALERRNFLTEKPE